MNENFAINSGLTRRELLKKAVIVTALSSGFARAVEPVSAQTIHTGSTGLVAEEVRIPTQNGVIPGYSARPEGDGPFPLVVVVHEIFGVHEHIKDICRRFAKRGYSAVAPDLFAREGDVSKIGDIKDIMPIVAKAPDAQVMTDIDSAISWAVKNANGDEARLGITGFCWGGRIVWLYTAHSTVLKAGVAWYGRVVGQTDPLHPANPIDIANDLHAPVLGLYGGQDRSIPVPTLDQVKSAALADGKTVEIVVYPDAGHAFHADYRPSYNAADAADGDAKMYAWFEKYGVK